MDNLSVGLHRRQNDSDDQRDKFCFGRASVDSLNSACLLSSRNKGSRPERLSQIIAGAPKRDTHNSTFLVSSSPCLEGSTKKKTKEDLPSAASCRLVNCVETSNRSRGEVHKQASGIKCDSTPLHNLIIGQDLDKTITIEKKTLNSTFTASTDHVKRKTSLQPEIQSRIRVEDWHKKIGCRVVVDGQQSGFLRFYGRTFFYPGNWCGVELDNPGGKNDGAVNGIRYFTCLPRHGLFAQPHVVQLTPIQAESSPTGSSDGGESLGLLNMVSSVNSDIMSESWNSNVSTSISDPSGNKNLLQQLILKSYPSGNKEDVLNGNGQGGTCTDGKPMPPIIATSVTSIDGDGYQGDAENEG